ncbi:hypothetical protein V8C86DRAFT_1376208 [Haematococcus lacustris]
MSRPCSSSSSNSNGVPPTCSSSSSNGGAGGSGGGGAAALRGSPSSKMWGSLYSKGLPLNAQASAGAVTTRSGSSAPPPLTPQAGGLASAAAAGSGAGAARQLSRRGSGSAVRRLACPLACPTPDPAATQPASAGQEGEGRSAADEGGWVDGGGACLGVGGGAAGPKAADLALLEGEGGAGCTALLLRLEAELRALDAEELAPSDLITWAADMEGAMARMDALQTGYQVLGQLPAGSSEQRSEVHPGPCGASLRLLAGR